MGLRFFSPRGFFGLKFLCPRFLGPRFSVSQVIGTKPLDYKFSTALDFRVKGFLVLTNRFLGPRFFGSKVIWVLGFLGSRLFGSQVLWVIGFEVLGFFGSKVLGLGLSLQFSEFQVVFGFRVFGSLRFIESSIVVLVSQVSGFLSQGSKFFLICRKIFRFILRNIKVFDTL